MKFILSLIIFCTFFTTIFSNPFELFNLKRRGNNALVTLHERIKHIQEQFQPTFDTIDEEISQENKKVLLQNLMVLDIYRNYIRQIDTALNQLDNADTAICRIIEKLKDRYINIFFVTIEKRAQTFTEQEEFALKLQHAYDQQKPALDALRKNLEKLKKFVMHNSPHAFIQSQKAYSIFNQHNKFHDHDMIQSYKFYSTNSSREYAKKSSTLSYYAHNQQTPEFWTFGMTQS